MFKVKLSFPYPYWPLIRQTPEAKSIWGNYQFYINEGEDADYWFVFNYPNLPEEHCNVPKENVVLITGEPSSVDLYNPSYFKQFAHIITSQKEIKHKRVYFQPQGLPWFVNKSYDELLHINKIGKTKIISVITSNKLITDGHKRRYEFVLKLKDYFGDVLSVYGRGINQFEDKWEVIAPFKYSIAIENSSFEDYITEKLYDCFLSLTFPIYYGAPNVGKYFKEDSFSRINIKDFDGSRRIIENTINCENNYDSKLSFLLESKDKVLNEYNLFPLIVNFIERNLKKEIAKKKVIKIKGIQFFLQESLGKRILKKGYKLVFSKNNGANDL